MIGVLKESYSSTEVVLVGEIIKLIFSGYLAIVDRSETGEFRHYDMRGRLSFGEEECLHPMNHDNTNHFLLALTREDASGSGVSKLLWLIMHSRKIIILVILYR